MSESTGDFVDEVTLLVTSGAGGKGCVAWRREPFVPRGGPAGGDGGRGGDVVLVADPGIHTLLDLRHRKHLKAERGQDGGGADKTGACGVDAIVRVPVGTVASDAGTGDVLGDLSAAGQRLVVAVGGHGGRGNAHFRRPTHQAPEESSDGGPAIDRRLRLELKLLADVGLVGLPNAGKSTLIARISRARPRVADYPFTTLVPNLGVVAVDDERSLVVADVPGLIEGAHRGAGLGHRFLRHVERTGVLVLLVDQDDAGGRDAVGALETLARELVLFDEALAERPWVVVLNKIDLPDCRAALARVEAAAAARNLPFMAASGATGEGVGALVAALWKAVDESRRAGARPAGPAGTDAPP